MIYKCAKCGEEFKDMKKCDVHEKNCTPVDRINHLEKMIASLSMKIMDLETRLVAMEAASINKYSTYPYIVNPTVSPHEKLIMTSRTDECNLEKNK